MSFMVLPECIVTLSATAALRSASSVLALAGDMPKVLPTTLTHVAQSAAAAAAKSDDLCTVQ